MFVLIEFDRNVAMFELELCSRTLHIEASAVELKIGSGILDRFITVYVCVLIELMQIEFDRNVVTADLDRCHRILCG